QRRAHSGTSALDRARTVASDGSGRCSSRKATNSARNSSTSESNESCTVLLGDQCAVLRGGSEHVLPRPGTLERELQVVLPGEAHGAEQLQTTAEDRRLAFSRSGFGHGGGEATARVVLRDRQCREIREGAGTFDGDVHVGGAMLDGLERPDRHTELLAAAHVV